MTVVDGTTGSESLTFSIIVKIATCSQSSEKITLSVVEPAKDQNYAVGSGFA